MVDSDAFSVVSELLKPETFYEPRHQKIYEAIRNMNMDERPVDIMTLNDELSKMGEIDKVGGVDYLMEISSQVASAAHVESHARILAEKYMQRQLIHFAGDIETKAYDSSVIRQPACGQVDLSYFSDAAFLGDSLTVGFSDYSINLGGALICGYTGVGPDAIVNRSAVKSPTRGQEVALDVLAAAQPKKLYILLGTNTLTTLGAADRFLAYYGQMLDLLRQTLGDDCVIYVQSIPPVRPAAAEEKPGLASDVLRSVNEQLAQMAADKGCVYLDLWETFADGEGSLKEILAAPDGVHFSAGNGYGAWVTYLRNHAKYSAANAWTPGSAYAGN